ncbi:MAG: Crp/Fnr family transcriptional regulator [Cellulophaga sp.]
MIKEEILIECGAIRKVYRKGEFIFYKGDEARYYYQIISGEVKMNNFNDMGKEFIQGIFKEGRSFGEPPLFIDRVYPSNAQVLKDVEVLVLPKAKFLKDVLRRDTCIEVLETFAKRLYYKSLLAVEMSSEGPEHRILSVLDYFKIYIEKNTSDTLYKFDFTRQELANLTGLRVETVIRAIKSLESKGDIKIINRKVYR